MLWYVYAIRHAPLALKICRAPAAAGTSCYSVARVDGYISNEISMAQMGIEV